MSNRVRTDESEPLSSAIAHLAAAKQIVHRAQSHELQDLIEVALAEAYRQITSRAV